MHLGCVLFQQSPTVLRSETFLAVHAVLPPPLLLRCPPSLSLLITSIIAALILSRARFNMASTAIYTYTDKKQRIKPLLDNWSNKNT